MLTDEEKAMTDDELRALARKLEAQRAAQVEEANELRDYLAAIKAGFSHEELLRAGREVEAAGLTGKVTPWDWARSHRS